MALACGSDDTSSETPSTDAGADTTSPNDAAADTALDGDETDTGAADTGGEAATDSGPDAEVDAATDAEVDAATDAEADAATEEQAIAAYADALCGLFANCAPYMLNYLYGGEQTCIDRYVAGGRVALLPQAPGVARSAADLTACADAMGTMTCEELYGGARDTACPKVPGTLGEGESCFSDLQCESGFCDRSGECGMCAPSLALGDNCEVANNGCPDDMECYAPTLADPTTCTATAGENEACSTTTVCRGNLFCDEGTCVQPGGDGDSCTAVNGACNGLLGLGCSSGTCQQLGAFADVGQPCGIQGSSYIPCLGTSYCDSTTQKCVAKAGDGEPCETAASNTCLYYASCQNDVCVVDTEPTCP